MRGKLLLNDDSFQVETKASPEGILVKVNDKDLFVHLQEIEHGFLARIGDTTLRLDLPAEQRDLLRLSRKTDLSVDGHLFQTLFQPQRPPRTPQADISSDGPKEGSITAFMPGTIVRILTEPQQAVREGDVLLILEAMKMENEVKSPFDGLVEAILVTPGLAVQKGTILLQIAPLAKPDA